MTKTAIFSCRGLGDAMITLTITQNLVRAGEEVVTFHPFLHSLQAWYPHLTLRPHPETFEELTHFDRFIFFYEASLKMLGMIRFCEENFPEKTFVLNPIATTRHDIPYWETGRFDGTKPLVHNLLDFCRRELHVKEPTLNNGITPLKGLTFQKYPKRVAIHPLSSGDWKNWPKAKFIRLGQRLRAQGYEVSYILASYERPGWEEVEAPLFSSISEMMSFVYESGLLIGNDSGVGHLASSFGLPTLTICRNLRVGNFWRPVWSKGHLVVPSRWIPNSKGLRLRDKQWKRWISVDAVLRGLEEL